MPLDKFTSPLYKLNMFRLLLFTFFIPILLNAQSYDYDIKPAWLKSSKYMNINILDSKELVFDSIDGIKITELSALAFYDNKLYSLSDRGYLYTFDIKIINNKIEKIKLLNATSLKNKNNKGFKKKKRDSEGLCFLDENLLVSFEKEPRVSLFSKNAVKIKSIKIHKNLKNIDNYIGKNKALESVAYNKKYKTVTAPEIPLKANNKNFHTIYAKNKIFKFKASGKITAIEFMNDDDILVLERTYNKNRQPSSITFTRVSLDQCKDNICKSDLLAQLGIADGWKIDNFEGLTKVDKNRYLMISDNNDNSFQKTLLVLFEI